jgi:hypothetical protein
MGYISRTACDTAVDFCARLCFPQVADEPPRLFRFSPLSLPLALQSAARRNETDETYVYHNKKNEPLIKHVDHWFVFHLS